MASRDYVVPPEYKYESSRGSTRSVSRINTVVRDIRSSIADYRNEERRLNESTRYPESVRSNAEYDSKVTKQNEILTKQLMFYRAQAGDLDKKLRQATNLLESTVLEIQAKPGMANAEDLYLENQELKKRLQEILIRGGQAGTIGYSSQIAKLKQRVEEQDRQLDASKELYNELRKKFDELNESVVEAGNLPRRNEIRTVATDGRVDVSKEKELNAIIKQQEGAIRELNEEMKAMEELIQANQRQSRRTPYQIFIEQEDKIEELRTENVRLRSDQEKYETLQQTLLEKEQTFNDNIPSFNFEEKEKFDQTKINFKPEVFDESAVPLANNTTGLLLDDIPSEFKAPIHTQIF
ncbi:Oidioi.mRNA.OKI2018_I69.PAR.g9420.t1.cds [Oikopleura dioica]|uniref:Oidioi.mRNA.OKI2018_I69.PAR.g9420.t1.cds n=1 Tax=Oikopleura dioica TaxID=34765 RepID=A0ABN7RP27_OIKDI|nr:Oidioi.mRNA.OKI2018_I69.PAR.g9420.t1.cds [Oikopleura dioica]